MIKNFNKIFYFLECVTQQHLYTPILITQ